MAETFQGKVRIVDSASRALIELSGDFGTIVAGDHGHGGDIVLKDKDGKEKFHIDAQNGIIRIRNADEKLVMRIEGAGGNIWSGGNGVDGDLVLFRSDGDNTTHNKASMHLDGQGANAWFGGNGADGDLLLFPSTASEAINDTGKAHVHLDGQGSNVYLKRDGKNRVRLDGGGGNVWLGGNGADGDLVLFRSDGDNATLSGATIHLDGQNANAWLGGHGSDGDLVLFPSSATNINDLDQATIHLDGQSGDIRLSNADCAEDFDIRDSANIEPGTVMVLTEDGMLEASTIAYDTKVAGVVSGAAGLRPGLVLDAHPSQYGRLPIALMGKVYCRVDARQTPIKVGDMLTTSATPGYAMKATDATRTLGAVIGKALESLDGGLGLIKILASLQ